MKKFVTVLLVLMALPVSVFAVDISISAGGGGLFGYTFTRYVMEGGGTKSFQSMDRIDYAGFAFIDATYAEFSILYKGGRHTWEENMSLNSSSLGNSKGIGTSNSLGFSLMGKYPFAVTENIIWFPMFGLEYHVAIVESRQPEGYPFAYNRTEGHERVDRDKNDEPYALSAWNSLWINIGAGLDYFFTHRLFLRADFQFGFRLPTTHELGSLEVVQEQMKVNNPTLAGLTGSPTIRIAIGHRW